MGNRLHKSQAPASASEALVKRLKAAANDAVLLQEIIKSNDSASIAAAFAALLGGGSSSAANSPELQKKAHSRPCPLLPVESFIEVVLFADRDTLDAMQLVCRFLLNFIRERELTHLALRDISRVSIVYNDEWMPTIKMDYSRRAAIEFAPKSFGQLTSCLRMAFCGMLYVEVSTVPERESAFSIVVGMILEDLAALSMFVDTLAIHLARCEVEVALRGIAAFKSVKRVIVGSHKASTYAKLLDETFLVSAAQRGVRYLKHFHKGWPLVPSVRVTTTAAIAFGFAEPTAGGNRSLQGIHCGVGEDFLAQVKQKAGALRDAHYVNFTFSLDADVSLRIDSTGFEKYQRGDGRTWLMEDLDNLVNVEVKHIENLIEIHVFSSY